MTPEQDQLAQDQLAQDIAAEIDQKFIEQVNTAMLNAIVNTNTSEVSTAATNFIRTKLRGHSFASQILQPVDVSEEITINFDKELEKIKINQPRNFTLEL